MMRLDSRLRGNSDFAHFDSLPPSEALISLCTTEKQCLAVHDIYLIINKLALKVCEVGKKTNKTGFNTLCQGRPD